MERMTFYDVSDALPGSSSSPERASGNKNGSSAFPKWFKKKRSKDGKHSKSKSPKPRKGHVKEIKSKQNSRVKSRRNKEELFSIESAVASTEELHLQKVSNEQVAEHVALVWTYKDLTEAQIRHLKFKGYSKRKLPTALYLGDRHIACDRARLEHLKVEFIVNCTHSTPCLFEQETVGSGLDRFRYHRVPLSDDSLENLLEHLPEAINFMNDCKSDELFKVKSGVTLVHCSYGVSRSASVVIAWMMCTLGSSLREALSIVCQRRTKAKPNQIFIKQLMELEIDLFGPENASMHEEDFEPCIICLKTNFAFAKQPMECGHKCCADCIEAGETECTHCAYARGAYS